MRTHYSDAVAFIQVEQSLYNLVSKIQNLEYFYGGSTRSKSKIGAFYGFCPNLLNYLLL